MSEQKTLWNNLDSGGELNHQDLLPDMGILRTKIFKVSGADPGFPVGGGANPLGGRQHMILPNFAKNCMKLRKFWAVGGGGARRGAPPLNPPLGIDFLHLMFITLNTILGVSIAFVTFIFSSIPKVVRF